MLRPYYMRAYLPPLPPFPSVEYRLPHELIDYPNGASPRYCRDALISSSLRALLSRFIIPGTSSDVPSKLLMSRSPSP
jgi:hypothetical protein